MEKYENGSLPLLKHRIDKNINKYHSISNTTTTINPKYTATSSKDSNNYEQTDLSNYFLNYFNFLQKRQKIDSYYFGNLSRRNDKHCTDPKCFINRTKYPIMDGRNKTNRSEHIPFNIRPPYAADYDSSNCFDAFTEYMNASK